MYSHRLRGIFSPLPHRPEEGYRAFRSMPAAAAASSGVTAVGNDETTSHCAPGAGTQFFFGAPSHGKQQVPVQALVAEAAVKRFKVRVIESGSAQSDEFSDVSSAGSHNKGLNWSLDHSNTHFQNTTRIRAAYPGHLIFTSSSTYCGATNYPHNLIQPPCRPNSCTSPVSYCSCAPRSIFCCFLPTTTPRHLSPNGYFTPPACAYPACSWGVALYLMYKFWQQNIDFSSHSLSSFRWHWPTTGFLPLFSKMLCGRGNLRTVAHHFRAASYLRRTKQQ